MSRQEFVNFVKTVEHTLEDLNYDKTATKFELWFKNSKINPLK